MRPYALTLAAAVFLTAAPPLQAQDAPPPQHSAYAPEHTLIESVIGAVVEVVRDVALQSDGTAVGERLRSMVSQLQATPSANIRTMPLVNVDGATPAADATRVHAAIAADDLRELARLLDELHAEVRTLREVLVNEQSYDLADRLLPVQRSLDEAADRAARLADNEADFADDDGWLRPGRYEDRDEARREAREAEREAREEAREARANARRNWDFDFSWGDDEEETWKHDDENDRKRTRRHRRDPFHDDPRMAAMIGEFPYRWPYREQALYRTIPAVRYNRVEGFVLGVGAEPLVWDDWERGTIFGQVGYAFALADWRYEVGAETFLAGHRRGGDTSLKLGALYRHNTATNDLWKSNWLENSLAAFFFENDFFDYYDVEGWSVYSVGRLGTAAQVSAGFRAEDYASLARNTGWSLFDGGGFRYNPAITEGFMQSFVFAFEGGRVDDLDDLPRGAAFRAEAEIGEGVGGDFSFNRYLADGRVYVPVNRHSALALRLRAGTTTGDVPVQKAFTIGGVGSVRAYPQNAFYGTRMVLANAEYIVDEVSFFDGLFDDVQLFTFGDVGWTNDFGTNTIDFDDALAAVGIGVGLDERAARLELAWPVGDRAFTDSRRPSLWFRLSPTF